MLWTVNDLIFFKYKFMKNNAILSLYIVFWRWHLLVRYHIVCIHLKSDKLRIEGVGVVIAGHPTDTYEEFLPIEHLNNLLSKGHTCYFVNNGFGMEVSGFENGFIILDPNGIKNKNIRELGNCKPTKL